MCEKLYIWVTKKTMMREMSKSEKLFIFRLIVVIMGINFSISLYEYGFDGTRLLITVLVSAVVVPVISILFLLLFGKKTSE